MSTKTRILLVDDHKMLREGLRRLLETEPGMEVIGEAQDGRSAVTMASKLSPDVVVMDIGMPDMNGIDATRQIRAGDVNGDCPKVIALSAHSDHRFMSQMLAAGASGYVIKEAAFEELAMAVRSARADKVYLSPRVASTIVGDSVVGGKALLSPREREVLQLIADGKATKEVAAHLHISAKTVETYRKKMMEKLELEGIADLTKYAVREGITSLEN